MTCEEFIENFVYNGTLEPNVEAETFAHFARCAKCKKAITLLPKNNFSPEEVLNAMGKLSETMQKADPNIIKRAVLGDERNN